MLLWLYLGIVDDQPPFQEYFPDQPPVCNSVTCRQVAVGWDSESY